MLSTNHVSVRILGIELSVKKWFTVINETTFLPTILIRDIVVKKVLYNKNLFYNRIGEN